MAWKVGFYYWFWLFSNYYYILSILFLHPERDGFINYSFSCVWNGIKYFNIFPENIKFLFVELKFLHSLSLGHQTLFPCHCFTVSSLAFEFQHPDWLKAGLPLFQSQHNSHGIQCSHSPSLREISRSPWQPMGGAFGCRAWPIHGAKIDLCTTAPQGTENHQQMGFNVEESVYGSWFGKSYSWSWLAASRGAETPLLPWELGNSSTKDTSHLWVLSFWTFFQNLHRENLIGFVAECNGILEWLELEGMW